MQRLLCPPHLFQSDYSTCALRDLDLQLEHVLGPYCPFYLSRLDNTCVLPNTLHPNLRCSVWSAQTFLDTGPACVEMPGGIKWQERSGLPYCPTHLRRHGTVCYPVANFVTAAPAQKWAGQSTPFLNLQTDGRRREYHSRALFTVLPKKWVGYKSLFTDCIKDLGCPGHSYCRDGICSCLPGFFDLHCQQAGMFETYSSSTISLYFLKNYPIRGQAHRAGYLDLWRTGAKPTQR